MASFGNYTVVKLDAVADLRTALIDHGYTPVPVVTGNKMPRISGWQKLTPETHDVEAMLKAHPDHRSTGLLCGTLVAIDVDIMDEDAAREVQGLVSNLPEAEQALIRQGQAPKTLFLFRSKEPISKRLTPEYMIAGKKSQIEIMGLGQQIVAFGNHPVTMRPYEWIGDSPLDVAFHNLPLISADTIDKFLADAEIVLARHGTIKRATVPERVAAGGGDSFWQRVNTAALGKLDAWVPSLFPSAKQEAGTGSWRVTSSSLGRSLEEDLSINPDGIRDFGEERGETAISLVQKWGSSSSPKDAAHWLCARIGARPEDFGWNAEPTDLPTGTLSHPVAANDNVATLAQPKGLDIFAWPSSRFIGEPAPIEYLVDGVIESGIPGMIAAMGELGKSYALLELCRRVAFGSKFNTPIFGGHVIQEGTAVFLTGEDDQRSIHRRIAALDPRNARFAERGDKLIAVPLPSAVETFNPFWIEEKGVFKETDTWRRFAGQLSEIDDLRVVVVDPLQMFAALPINEDPAAGQFVCSQIAGLAARTGANVFFAHHMKKPGKDRIETLSDARDAIRGTSALVDGVRIAYALWYPDEDKGREEAKAIGVDYAPNMIVHGGVVKANGAARRIMSTYARSENGLLIDRSSLTDTLGTDQGELKSALVIAVEAAAKAEHPFTKTGASGLHANKERLPFELQALGRNKMEELCQACISDGTIVACVGKGSSIAKFLDVPGGPFAIGLAEVRRGAVRPTYA